ncbi:MAG: hypothetical protein EHM55_25035 [Acidobacteria bacterium]|nr:MAG: hypothetical protein EHM55_25035 [Acidobacteriota bacterium]
MKAIIKLVIAALVVHATWRAGNVYLRYYQFKDNVQQAAQFSDRRPEHELRERVMSLAGQYEIPLAPEALQVRREDNHTIVDATYTERIELLPRYFYPWEFKVNVDTFTYVAK